MAATFIGVGLGIVASNYIYQAFQAAPDWVLATERSWFQGCALLAVGLALAIKSINA